MVLFPYTQFLLYVQDKQSTGSLLQNVSDGQNGFIPPAERLLSFGDVKIFCVELSTESCADSHISSKAKYLK